MTGEKNIARELREVVSSIKKHIELERLAGTEEVLLPQKVKSELQDLSSLKKKVASCRECELHKTRTNVVFGAGDPRAKLLFVGEAPGMQEDLKGLPFVGRAGQLLTKIIESIGLKRNDVYIANILKCRPPNNRNPFPSEILACEGYLVSQIGLIRPKVICTLGKFAAQTLLRSQETISRLRGRFFEYRGAKLIPTYHPAYLLRNPNDKRLVWEDMKKIRKVLQES